MFYIFKHFTDFACRCWQNDKPWGDRQKTDLGEWCRRDMWLCSYLI